MTRRLTAKNFIGYVSEIFIPHNEHLHVYELQRRRLVSNVEIVNIGYLTPTFVETMLFSPARRITEFLKIRSLYLTFLLLIVHLRRPMRYAVYF